MDEVAIENLQAYTSRCHLRLIEYLGSGIHGTVYLVEGNSELGTAVLKAHFHEEPYLREKEIYERLAELNITNIRGFEVPCLLDSEDELRVLKMTVVMPPRVLDFAGAYLYFPPKHSDEVWEDWRRRNEEQFGDDWTMAQIILDDLQELGIHMHDPSPSNICFR